MHSLIASEKHPPVAIFLGQLGITAAMVFSTFGAAYGTAKTGLGVARLGMKKKESHVKGFVPVVMAGILSIYGLIASVMIQNHITAVGRYSLLKGWLHLGAGLAVGLSSLASGLAIGKVGQSCTQALISEEKLFAPMFIMLILAESLGVYGLIIGLLMDNIVIKIA